MSEDACLQTFVFQGDNLAEAIEFLKGTRSGLRTLRKVRIWKDKFQLFDVNADYFEIQNLGYQSPEIIEILEAVNTPYNRDTIHNETSDSYKELKTGRRRPWAEDRIL